MMCRCACAWHTAATQGDLDGWRQRAQEPTPVSSCDSCTAFERGHTRGVTHNAPVLAYWGGRRGVGGSIVRCGQLAHHIPSPATCRALQQLLSTNLSTAAAPETAQQRLGAQWRLSLASSRSWTFIKSCQGACRGRLCAGRHPQRQRRSSGRTADAARLPHSPTAALLPPDWCVCPAVTSWRAPSRAPGSPSAPRRSLACCCCW
jgi:hypothetical protein